MPNWKDVNPRVSVAYDLFGNGKTALKASASRGVEQESIGIARLNNPASTVVTTTQRAWTDSQQQLRSRLRPGEPGVRTVSAEPT